MTLQSKLQTGTTTYPTSRLELSPPAQRIAETLYKAETYVRERLDLGNIVNTASDLYTSWRDHTLVTLEAGVKSARDYVIFKKSGNKARKEEKRKKELEERRKVRAERMKPKGGSKYAQKVRAGNKQPSSTDYDSIK